MIPFFRYRNGFFVKKKLNKIGIKILFLPKYDHLGKLLKGRFKWWLKKKEINTLKFLFCTRAVMSYIL